MKLEIDGLRGVLTSLCRKEAEIKQEKDLCDGPSLALCSGRRRHGGVEFALEGLRVLLRGPSRSFRSQQGGVYSQSL